MQHEQPKGGAPLDVIAASLRRERSYAGLSLTEVAKRASIAKSTLSQLESGTGNPSVETLWALAVALDVPLSRLFEPPVPQVRLIRAGEGPQIYSERAHYLCTLLSSCPPNAQRDLYQIVAQPGSARVSEPHMRGVIEHIVIATGRALVGPLDDPVELGPGDYISYPGDVAHIFEALEPDTRSFEISEHL
ncbi:helix-turn-helix domain-containing protein [Amycolatopsis sp. cg5]|uniref:helix-turn-helix domain-containing protein n=1 Tax=Amycolatopsis sp. cg5 TaxID=3238802 RepID=UPI0035239B20